MIKMHRVPLGNSVKIREKKPSSNTELSKISQSSIGELSKNSENLQKSSIRELSENKEKLANFHTGSVKITCSLS